MKIAKKFILKAGSQLNDERDTQMQEVTYLKEKLGGRGGEFGIPQSKKCSSFFEKCTVKDNCIMLCCICEIKNKIETIP